MSAPSVGMRGWQEKLINNSVTSQYLWPYKEDVTRFDFEVAEEDEHICEAMVRVTINGVVNKETNATDGMIESQA